jgi:hypothetical protein
LFVTVISRVFSQDLMPASRHQDHTTSPSASAPFVNGATRVHRIPTRVDDVGQRPSVGQDARLVELICPTGKAEYFYEQIWTGRIALIRFNNLASRRNGPQAVQTRSPDGAKRNPGRRSHRWINPSPNVNPAKLLLYLLNACCARGGALSLARSSSPRTSHWRCSE